MSSPFAPHSKTPLYSTTSQRGENDLMSNPYMSPKLPTRRRRRESSSDRAIRMAMKGVLLSPVIVLVAWSTFAIVFSNKHAVHSSNVKKMGRIHRQKNGVQKSLTEGASDVMEVASIVMGQAAPQKPLPIYAPLGSTGNGQPMIVQPVLQQQLQQQQQLAPVLYTQEQPMLALQQQLMQQQQQILQQQNAMQQQQAFQQVAPPIPMVAAPQQLQPPQQALAQQAAPLQQAQLQLQPRQETKNTKVYYYDPAEAVQENGNLKAPELVYDDQGRAIPFQSIQAKKVFMEPPPRGIYHHNITANENSTAFFNWTHPSVVSERIHRQRQAVLGAVLANDAESTDQSVILATVGIMALLVGALLARRLRGRSFLSACIENESLHNDAAYDTAYTSSADANSYHTFSWKQDLEKFDV